MLRLCLLGVGDEDEAISGTAAIVGTKGLQAAIGGEGTRAGENARDREAGGGESTPCRPSGCQL